MMWAMLLWHLVAGQISVLMPRSPDELGSHLRADVPGEAQNSERSPSDLCGLRERSSDFILAPCWSGNAMSQRFTVIVMLNRELGWIID